MELRNEHSAASCFSIEIQNPCFFHLRGEYCCLSYSERTLYKNVGENPGCLELDGEYRRIFYHGEAPEYVAYTWIRQKHEVILWFLDQHMRAFDRLKWNTGCTGEVEDMWLDKNSGRLYFVFPRSIQIYNLNGDFLQQLMTAPSDTRYQAICGEENRLFIAYDRFGCIYVAEYDCCGVFKQRLAIGSNFWVKNMEMIHTESDLMLNIYGERPGRLPVCMEILVEALPGSEACITDGDIQNDCCPASSRQSVICGTVCDDCNRPLPGRIVRLLQCTDRQNTCCLVIGETFSDCNGHYEIPIPPSCQGRYRIEVSASYGGREPVKRKNSICYY